MNEMGIFNDDGLLEGQLFSVVEVKNRFDFYKSSDISVYTAFVCPEHSDSEKDYCDDQENDDNG